MGMGSLSAGAATLGVGSFVSSFAAGRANQAQQRAQQQENERLNKLTWQAMGNRINTVNLQRGLLRQQTGTTLYDIGKEANRAGSASLSNAAASGTIGASVNDAANDIARQNQETQARVRAAEQIQEVNLDSSISDIIDNAVNQQRYSVKPASTWKIFGQALGSSAVTTSMVVAASSFDYMSTSGSNVGSSTSYASAYGSTSNDYGIDDSSLRPYNFSNLY